MKPAAMIDAPPASSDQPAAPPGRSRWSPWGPLAALALLLGLPILALGQYAFDDRLQTYFEKSAAWQAFRSPVLPRLAPGIVGVVVGGLLVALALRRLAPALFAEVVVPARSSARRTRLGWLLIALAIGVDV